MHQLLFISFYLAAMCSYHILDCSLIPSFIKQFLFFYFFGFDFCHFVMLQCVVIVYLIVHKLQYYEAILFLLRHDAICSYQNLDCS